LDSQTENLPIGLGLDGTGHAAGPRPVIEKRRGATVHREACGVMDAREGSFGAGEPDDGDAAVGLLFVAGVARLRLRNSLPCLRARVPVELGGGHS
jgi:hypothetical protein